MTEHDSAAPAPHPHDDAPASAASGPRAMMLEAGRTYGWCTCGLSQKVPLCDGSHKGTGKVSLRFTPESTGERWLCTCQKTQTPPFCDGSHAQKGGVS